MSKKNLKDVTFTIPIRYDTEHRIENLKLIVDFLQHHFDTNIMVMEEAKEQKFDFLQNKVDYTFVKTDDPNLHRTKCLNEMSKRCKTPIVVNYDADVLFTIPQYMTAADQIRKGKAEMVFPYAGRFMECNREKFFNKIRKGMSVDFIDEKELSCNHPNSLGGAIFWDLKTFKRIGMENQHFKSWGWEDNERMSRAQKLGVKIVRTKGILYHMSHKRLEDSKPNNKHYNKNQQEYNKVHNMSKTQLQDYIKTWSWLK